MKTGIKSQNKYSPSVSQHITNKTEKHIFEGEINSKGKATGVHHQNAILHGTAREIPGTRINGPNGIYKAKVEVYDSSKRIWIIKTANGGYSTFFPEIWSATKVKIEVTNAYNSKTKIPGTSNEW